MTDVQKTVGWAWVALGEIADVQLGKMLDKKKLAGKSLPYLRNINVRWGTIDATDLFSMPFQDHELDRYTVEAGDVLVCEGGEPGRAAVCSDAESKLKYQKALHRVRLPDCISPNWLVYSLRHDAEAGRLLEHFTGTTIAHFTRQAFRAYELPIAPLPEQHRIVEAIESYFTRLDDAVATLERTEKKLKRYRASVLKSAVEGRLVPTEASLAQAEGRDYEPASVLLERILVERRRRWEDSELAKLKAKGKLPKNDNWKAKYKEPIAPDASDLPELPEGWCWTTVDHFLCAIEAGKNFKCEERPPMNEQVGVVKVSSVSWGAFNQEESKTCTRHDLVKPEHFICPGDFLFSRANTIELVGACVIVVGVTKKLMLSDKILRLRFGGDLDRWLLWVLRSRHGRNEIERLASGNQESMRNISQTSLRNIRVPLPPQADADRVVGELDHLLSVAEATETQVRGNHRRCARLRQSVLKWAFEGKLADQDPNDEPASALLKRIKSEREAAAPATKTKRKARKKKGVA